MNKEQEKVTEGIVNLLESGASEQEIYATIEEFKEKFADYGRDRRSAIEFHLRNVERLLMPTQTTTVAMRALQGTPGSNQQSELPTAAEEKDSQQQQQQLEPVVSSGTASSETNKATAASTDNKPAPLTTQDPKALFQYLVNHLEVSPEQGAALKDSRFVAQELDGHLEKALKVLEELKSRLTKCGEDLEAEFDNVRSILTPTQAAKFLIWVANNGACMHMLNELWSRAYGLSSDPLDAEPSEAASSPDEKQPS